MSQLLSTALHICLTRVALESLRSGCLSLHLCSPTLHTSAFRLIPKSNTEQNFTLDKFRSMKFNSWTCFYFVIVDKVSQPNAGTQEQEKEKIQYQTISLLLTSFWSEKYKIECKQKGTYVSECSFTVSCFKFPSLLKPWKQWFSHNSNQSAG